MSSRLACLLLLKLVTYQQSDSPRHDIRQIEQKLAKRLAKEMKTEDTDPDPSVVGFSYRI